MTFSPVVCCVVVVVVCCLVIGSCYETSQSRPNVRGRGSNSQSAKRPKQAIHPRYNANNVTLNRGRTYTQRTPVDRTRRIGTIDNQKTNYLQWLLGVSPSKEKQITQPYSGESIRLRSSQKFYTSGLVEVYRAGRWGYVCDDNWDLQDGNVACRQLGFIKGASKVSMGDEVVPLRNMDSHEVLMDDVACSGDESRLQDCEYSTLHDCSPAEAATVTCQDNSGCPEGWVSGFGKCYKFIAKAPNYMKALEYCLSKNATLLTIDSAEENHFLSNVIKNNMPDQRQWLTGGKKLQGEWSWFQVVTQRSRTSGKSYRLVASPIVGDKWFPGWHQVRNVHAEPANRRKFDCLTLSDEYLDPWNITRILDYFFWKADTCQKSAGIDFICQSTASETEDNTDCYTEDGSTYRGLAQTTVSGSLCLNWDDSMVVNSRTHPNMGLGDHNFCRNPDREKRPWCWVSHEEQKFGFCKVDRCTHASVVEVTTKPSALNCPASEFYCSLDQKCIPALFRCDRDFDCPSKEDEDDCEYATSIFERYKDQVLTLNDDTLVYSTTAYEGISAEMCARKCRDASEFLCRSFTYDTRLVRCALSSFNTNHGTLKPASAIDYYEITSQRDCTGKFICENKFCVDKGVVCDGENDCKDMSDELNCSTEVTPDSVDNVLSVRLVGGQEHSGTVEVTYMGVTGVVCDDEWSIEDAQVVCRMLGYRAAKRHTILNEFDYPTEGFQFLLDNVQCSGNETSLKDCKKEAWRTHDCRSYEIAGVECKTSKVCEPSQFRCKNSFCVEPSDVCNGKDDCEDNSDETNCSMPEIQVRLVNGSDIWEGRVEIVRNGLAGTVCDDHWDDKDAQVLCRMLGYRHGGEAKLNGYYGRGQGPIWLDDVRCSGTELSLSNCSHAGWGRADCEHREDAGVRCHLTSGLTSRRSITHTPTTKAIPSAPTTLPPSDTITVRLVGGSKPSEGNVELLVHGKIFRVCDDNWDVNDCRVVCRMLGYTNGGHPTKESFYPDSKTVPILLDEVDCVGTEQSLEMCMANSLEHDCTNKEYAGVVCRDNTETSSAGALTCGGRPFDHKDVFNHSRVARDTSHAHPHWATKIIAGRIAMHGAIPWQAKLNLVFSPTHIGHQCGGVVFSEHWVLTAAHCVTGRRKSHFRLSVGEHSGKKTDVGEQTFQLDNIIMHQNYAAKNNDIALLKVKPINGRGIQFNDFVQPACLPGPETEYIEGTTCIISGWGNMERSEFYTSYPDLLKEADVPIMSDRTCSRLYRSSIAPLNTRTMFCAGYLSGKMDSCAGDSGGPLVCRLDGVYTVLGLTSWGNGCGQPNSPGVYVRLKEFIPWILSTIQAHSSDSQQKELPKNP
ncbi:uncharacterized protein LOC131930260 isoform X2 [Physella acuta]|uniref:uncharacterized protein LOC131930260 isoform X2 n=1 Tax=Physella acuta TaxID=109671 RepID=UPI0027DB7E0E|nr:uncharacterized protein LOC131930260 isoform X2 [Physella acuta]